VLLRNGRNRVLGTYYQCSRDQNELARVQGIRAFPEPTSVKAVRSFIGMVNYFRDHIPMLSTLLIPLFVMFKKRSIFDEFKLTDAARVAFHTVKELLQDYVELVLMTEKDPLILYTDASTNWRGLTDSRWN
jgi:hypothetical protein